MDANSAVSTMAKTVATGCYIKQCNVTAYRKNGRPVKKGNSAQLSSSKLIHGISAG